MKSAWRDRLLLAGWASLLLATTFLHPSLMAYDEGNFAAEARFMAESGRWLSRLWWGEPVYTHGVLLNWLMVVSFKVFGIGAQAARLPSAIACLTAVLLTYDISRIITGRRVIGCLAAAMLMLFHLWFQYGHLATQDMLLVCLELLGIWGLLKAEAKPNQRIAWGFMSGLVLGLGFLTKSFMILLPAAALVPYLVLQQRRHRHLTNPGLYLGLVTGVGLVGLWLWLSVAQYGDVVMASLFGKIGELGGKSFHADAGRFYYLWNIPVNAFPWPLFSMIGAWFCWRDDQQTASKNPYRWLLIYPFVLAGLLTSFSTRTPYYTLQLHPFMALFGAIALHRIAHQTVRWPRRLLSYSFAALGAILMAIPIAALLYIGANFNSSTPADSASSQAFGIAAEILPYAPIALTLGCGWLWLPVWMRQPRKWIATWLLSVWLGLGVAGLTGLFGDYSPGLMAALGRSPTAEIIATHPINFVTGTDWPDQEAQKTLILLSFYTPTLGQLNQLFDELTPGSYAWLAPNADTDKLMTERPYERIAPVQQWELIHFLTP
ncbi:MAG: glycosyltransferase family 39 protein [Phormidesmis sp.]